MYKLTIISGPNVGTSYPLSDGRITIGRQSGNVIVLNSSRVSKRHCVLVVDNTKVLVKDEGSANGTFVNGVLTRAKKLKAGDRITVGDFVFEVKEPKARNYSSVPALSGFGEVIQFPTQNQAQADPMAGAIVNSAGVPTDAKGKFFQIFESYVMPFFYNINLRQDWKTLVAGLLGWFTILNLVVSVYPMIEANKETIILESARRARFIAEQISQRNSVAVASGVESKAELYGLDREAGVQTAVLVDLDNRIIAPSEKLNQYLVSGPAASFALSAAKKFSSGKETAVLENRDGLVFAAEPLKVFDSSQGRNVTRAMAIVSIDTSLGTPDIGSIGLIYSKALIFSGFMGIFLFIILFRITSKPIEIMSEDLDKALKGELPSLSNDLKFEELEQLKERINSAIQRIPRNSMESMANSGTSVSIDDFLGPIKLLGTVSSASFMVCDEKKKILFMNESFEELTGIRLNDAIGKEISEVARDQAMSVVTNDLFERAQLAASVVADDFEFSGMPFKLQASVFGNGTPRGYLLTATKVEA